MPDPSDCRPRWAGTEDAALVEAAIAEQTGILTNLIGPQAKDIVDVCRGPRGRSYPMSLCERQLRILRFALVRAMHTI